MSSSVLLTCVRKIAGLTVQESTDPEFLKRKLEKLEEDLKELTQAQRSKYFLKDVKLKLKEHLASKVHILQTFAKKTVGSDDWPEKIGSCSLFQVATRDQLAEKTDLLKYKTQKLKLAVEAAEAYMKLQPPHQTVGDAVVSALHRANTQRALNRSSGTQAERRCSADS